MGLADQPGPSDPPCRQRHRRPAPRGGRPGYRSMGRTGDNMIKNFALAFTLALSTTLSPANAQTAASSIATPLLTTVEQKLAEGPAGARFGVLVTTLDGE